MLDWKDTLLNYLRLSNEDERVLGFVSSILLPAFSTLETPMNWLEIGPGPGTKTARIADTIRASKSIALSRSQMLEPSPVWRDHLRRHYPQLVDSTALTDSPLEEYAARATALSDSWQPNFITCFHVLYEADLIHVYFELLKHVYSCGRPFLACALVEAEDSDLFKLRQKLMLRGIVRPLPAVTLIREVAGKSGLKVREFRVNGQHLHIAHDPVSLRWFLAFLLGIDTSAVEMLPETTRNECFDEIYRFVSQKADHRLEIPDTAFVVSNQ